MKTVFKESLNAICNIVGHKWRYQDYSNWIKENGDPYDFKASRTCMRCRERAYFYDSWVPAREKMTKYDVKSRCRVFQNPTLLTTLSIKFKN